MSRPKEVTDDQIIEAARRVFLAHGPQTPVARVASELGVSSTALHLRMGTKKALLLKALCPRDPPVLASLSDGPDVARPIRRQLTQILLEILAWAREEIPATFAMHVAGTSPEPGDETENSQPARLRRALAAWLTRLPSDNSPSVAPGVAADMLVGVLEARALHEFITGKCSSRRADSTYVNQVVSTVVRSSPR